MTATRRPLPGVPGVSFGYWIGSENRVFVRYNGPVEALVAAGVVSAEMLAPRSRPWNRRRDDRNLAFRLSRYFGSKDRRPVAKAALTWRVSREQALTLPGVARAVAEGLHEEAEEQARLQLRVFDTMMAGTQALRETEPPKPRPMLH